MVVGGEGMRDEEMGIVEEAARLVRSKRADAWFSYGRLSPPSDLRMLSLAPEILKYQSRGRLGGARRTTDYF